MVVQCRRHVAAGEIDIAAGRYVDVELEEPTDSWMTSPRRS
jgi:predicted transcriptional regulator